MLHLLSSSGQDMHYVHCALSYACMVLLTGIDLQNIHFGVVLDAFVHTVGNISTTPIFFPSFLFSGTPLFRTPLDQKAA